MRPATIVRLLGVSSRYSIVGVALRGDDREVRPEEAVEEVLLENANRALGAGDDQRRAPVLAAVVGDGGQIADVIEVRVADEARLELALRLELEAAGQRAGVDREIVVKKNALVRCLGVSPPWQPITRSSIRRLLRSSPLRRHLQELEKVLEAAHVGDEQRAVVALLKQAEADRAVQHVFGDRCVDADLVGELSGAESDAMPSSLGCPEASAWRSSPSITRPSGPGA